MAEKYQFNEHDLGDIFRQVWGYAAPPFLFSLQNKVEDALFGKNEESGEYEFDKPMVERERNIQSVSFYAENNNCNRMFLPIWLIKPDNSKFLLQNTVSTMYSKKTIVETPLVNRKGTVKEEMAVEDWIIDIKGLIVSTDMDYPDWEVFQLNELYEQSTSLGIENARTSLILKEDERVVIKSLRFPEIKGMKNIQAFEMSLVSDIPFSLTIE
ncbi:DUF6046 domain-containing protein [Dysgonomonas sp. 520]|uniref:DUF6046 domain-containing protein n=1 Tax=Dysgonomonas sp. 520 TaxID=2302931 RepID=UPI0013D5243A|nr:DUF6046 domain-containing protein [Dysgonomonas sp. 520]NDW10448.1 hypothetical protein [Dysgonomonas sp. 520]